MAGRYILFGGPINTGDNLYRWNYDTANHLIHMLYYGWNVTDVMVGLYMSLRDVTYKDGSI